MIKRILKRLLEYCPRPSKPLTTTLKRYSIPTIVLVTGSVAIFATVSYFLLFSGATPQPAAPQTILPLSLPELPTSQSDYLPGVSGGDYVIYSDYECNFSHPTGPEWDMHVCSCAMDWKKVEVIEVSGKKVILRYTERLKNGSATDHDGCVHLIEDIEYPGRINCSYYSGYYFEDIVVAANLTEGDWIHSSGPCRWPWHLVNKTEIRTYLGVNRWVNIIKYSSGSSLTNLIFDVECGILLEHEVIGPNNERSSHRLVETNIFSSP